MADLFWAWIRGLGLVFLAMGVFEVLGKLMRPRRSHCVDGCVNTCGDRCVRNELRSKIPRARIHSDRQ